MCRPQVRLLSQITFANMLSSGRPWGSSREGAYYRFQRKGKKCDKQVKSKGKIHFIEVNETGPQMFRESLSRPDPDLP